MWGSKGFVTRRIFERFTFPDGCCSLWGILQNVGPFPPPLLMGGQETGRPRVALTWRTSILNHKEWKTMLPLVLRVFELDEKAQQLHQNQGSQAGMLSVRSWMLGK